MEELSRLIESMPDKDVEIKKRGNGNVDIVINSGRKKRLAFTPIRMARATLQATR